MGNPYGAPPSLYPVGCRTEKADLIPGSKNAGYEVQSMTIREILHQTYECYYDDLAVKSHKRVDHLESSIAPT